MLSFIRRRALMAVFGLAYGVVVLPKCTAQDSKSSSGESQPAVLTIRLPVEAELEIDGAAHAETGDVRRFTSQPLVPGKPSVFKVKARWDDGGPKKRVVEKRVTARAGQSIELDMIRESLSPDERLVLDLTNKEREKAGLAPLRIDLKLCRVARDHSANMARQNIMSHELDGKTFFQRVAEVGYRSGESGENCAQFSRSPGEAMAGWMNSSGHRENILNARFQEIGIGVALNRGGRKYWTQVFATPAPSRTN